MFDRDPQVPRRLDLMRSESGRGEPTRRAMVSGLLGTVGLALLGRTASAEETDPTPVVGDCSDLEGLQLLFDWLGQRVVIPPDELRPGPDWKLFTTSGMTSSFFYPPDWTARPIWASDLTSSGAIDWQTTYFAGAYLAGARLQSPYKDATYEYVSGVLVGVELDLAGAASAAEQGVLGQRKTTKTICVYEGTLATGASWTRAGSYDGSIVVTGGNIATLNEGQGQYALSTLSYQTFIGPEKEFTSHMRKVFIPIVFQMLVGSGGSAPVSGDDGDDENGDDDID